MIKDKFPTYGEYKESLAKLNAKVNPEDYEPRNGVEMVYYSKEHKELCEKLLTSKDA